MADENVMGVENEGEPQPLRLQCHAISLYNTVSVKLKDRPLK